MNLLLIVLGFSLLIVSTLIRLLPIFNKSENYLLSLPVFFPRVDPLGIMLFSIQWSGILWIITGFTVYPLINNIENVILKDFFEVVIIGIPLFLQLILLRIIRYKKN
jgi:hypothetical protein